MRQRYGKFVAEKKQLSKFYYGFSIKEIVLIIIFIIISSFISFLPIIPDDPLKIISALTIFALIIFTSIITKKLSARYYSLKIEHDIWNLYRYGIYKRSHFKKFIPLGLILPFSLSILSLGYLKPFTFFQYEYEDITSRRLLKMRGWKRAYKKEFVNEADLAIIPALGFYSLLGLALIGYIIALFNIEFGSELAKYSIYYGLWNLVPVSNLDGAKVFFGGYFLWAFILILYIIALPFVV